MTMTGIGIKREGTQLTFSFNFKGKFFWCAATFARPSPRMLPRDPGDISRLSKEPQNGFRNRINLLQGEQSGFIIYLREKGEVQEAR